MSDSDCDDEEDVFEPSSIHVLNHTIENLLSLITTKDVLYSEIPKDQGSEQVYLQKKVHITLECEKGQEEKRKSKVLEDTLKRSVECRSSPLKRIKMDTDVFRRFSPRRISFIRKNREYRKSCQEKLAESSYLRPKRKRDMLQSFVKQGLCLSIRD